MFNLRADTGFNSYAIGCYKSDTGIEDKDVMDPVTHCTKPSSHSSSLKRACFILTGNRCNLSTYLFEMVDIEAGDPSLVSA